MFYDFSGYSQNLLKTEDIRVKFMLTSTFRYFNKQAVKYIVTELEV